MKATDWFNSNVKMIYEYGIMNGISTNKFSPDGKVTVEEAITIAARINSIYKEYGDMSLSSSEPWYQDYVDYAGKNGIIALDSFPLEYSDPISRSDYAMIVVQMRSYRILNSRRAPILII